MDEDDDRTPEVTGADRAIARDIRSKMEAFNEAIRGASEAGIKVHFGVATHLGDASFCQVSGMTVEKRGRWSIFNVKL